MAINNNTPRNQYSGNGVQTAFTYGFEIFDESDIKVYVGSTLKTLTTDYTVSGVGNASGGSVTFVSAPINNSIVTLIRRVALERDTDLQQNSEMSSTAFNREYDRLWAKLIELSDELERSVRLAPEDATATLTLPLEADRAEKVLGFDENGDLAVTTLTLAEIEEQAGLAEAQAVAAAASAAAASSSASAAATSATNASNSATASANSATAAATSETNAETAEAGALAAQNAAETAETNAETAETNAETAATAAAGSASAASTSAGNASTSATNASNSASAASTSATNASNSASAASTSATNAANSASAASTSATNAANSATAAQTAQTAAENAAYDTVTLGITAAGSNQSGATALTTDVNEVTTTASSTGVRLPTPSAGGHIVVLNRGANALSVYPASGHQIDSLSTNAAFSLPAGTDLMLWAATSSRWLSHVSLARYS